VLSISAIKRHAGIHGRSFGDLVNDYEGNGPMSDRLLLKPEEAAAVLSIGRTKVYELIDRGDVRTVQIGRSRRIVRESLDEYVERLDSQRP
jgi:excisionase family DNA binding protein